MKKLLISLTLIFIGYLTIFSQTDKFLEEKRHKLEIKIEKVDLRIEKWIFDVQLQNISNKEIYIATNPQQVSGEKREYIEIDKDKSVVSISTRLYPRPIITPYSDNTRVELKKLIPSEIYKAQIIINFPLKETEPPFKYNVKSDIVKKSETLKKAVFSYAYFEKEEGIDVFLKRKPFGSFIIGNEKLSDGINKGKTFLDIQQLSFASILISDNKD